ncbi:MAG: ABC transporter ATP-binding protein [Clostridia bacterium]|nr:ABC transporter ATP-binding protein [Clostridia bacterium]
MENKALIVKNLCKSYGEKKAVNNISFDVDRGSLFAFLGENGAGKSTTINIICSILSKDSGTIEVEGYDLDKDRNIIKNLIGVTFQTSVIDDKLSVLDNLRIRTAFYSLSKEEAKRNIDRIVELLDLKPILRTQIRKLSGGQKRRVDIARAIVHEPKFLILDEPTTGLDPKSRIMVWDLINKIRKETQMTVFLTTHYLEEAEKASKVVVMNHGEIIAEGTPNELKNRFTSDYLIAYTSKNAELEAKLDKDNVEYKYFKELKAYKIKIKGTEDAKNLLKKYDSFLTDVEIKKGDMDDVFLNITRGGDKQ